LFELAYLPSPRSRRRRPSRACAPGPARAGVAVRDTHRSASDLPRGRRRRECAHPIELTAVSAIVLDLLSGFQRPSRRSPDLTVRRRADPCTVGIGGCQAPARGGNPSNFKDLCKHPCAELALERTQPAADPEVVRPRGRVSYRCTPTLSTWVRRPDPVKPAWNVFDCDLPPTATSAPRGSDRPLTTSPARLPTVLAPPPARGALDREFDGACQLPCFGASRPSVARSTLPRRHRSAETMASSSA